MRRFDTCHRARFEFYNLSKSGIDGLVAHADRALDEAKNAGRDRSVVHEPEVATVP